MSLCPVESVSQNDIFHNIKGFKIVFLTQAALMFLAFKVDHTFGLIRNPLAK